MMLLFASFLFAQWNSLRWRDLKDALPWVPENCPDGRGPDMSPRSQAWSRILTSSVEGLSDTVLGVGLEATRMARREQLRLPWG